MGSAMARNLVRAGHRVAAWDRTRGKIEALEEDGVAAAESPAEAAREVEVVFTSVSDDHALYDVVLGSTDGDGRGVRDPLIRGLAPGAVHVSLSTISPSFSRYLAERHHEADQGYVAAPVLGRPEAAERGELVVLAAGDDDALTLCEPLLAVLGTATHRLGTRPELANATKLAANFVLATLIEAFGEAYALAESYGVGSSLVLDILKHSLLRPDAIEAYGERIAKGQFEPAGFRLQVGLKDIDLILGAGEAVSLPMPIASVLRDRFLVAMAVGLGDKDWSAIARTLPRKRSASPNQGA
jgi:3-hydroxyisobutyrate dehydrogenase-like beta-hydroxyacid dehydrogenase